MKVKYKCPSGLGVLDLPDNSTLETVFDEIASRTNLVRFTLKYGLPSAMKSLDRRHGAEVARSLGLHGQTLTVVPEDLPSSSSDEETRVSALATRPPRAAGAAEASEDITIPWPEREGTVLLRVMPSDNSCLFTAFGGVLPKQVPAQRLRQMMADYIMKHSNIYSEAVLGSTQAAYCASIQNPDRWGGGIELSILSSIFDIQICTYDVQAQKLIQFGELKKDRCILVFSGIHYDRIAFSLSEYPYNRASLPPEMDRTIWPIEDTEILDKAQALVQRLHAAHYYTDTEGLILKCDVPGCDWIGSGQLAGRQHAEQTGHVQLSEIHDTQDDNVLQKCEFPGCVFIGQGSRAAQLHAGDTGHERFSVIPDI